MKRILSLFLMLALMVSLAACSSPTGQGAADPTPSTDEDAPSISIPEISPSNQPEDTTPPEGEPSTEPEDSGKNILIAYFSATNNTEGIANHLNSILDAELYEIVPETPYTSEDLNYNTDCRANDEQNDANARPAISGSVEDMEQYDIIFLGYPIWWGQAPKIMYTFLESYDMNGKTIVPFCTSGSSGVGSSATNLAEVALDAEWLEGHRFSGGASESDVQTWLDSLDLVK